MGSCLSSCYKALTAPDVGPDYVLVSKLGAGAQGEVYHIQNKATGKSYAAKLIPRGMPSRRAERIARELKIMAKLGEGHVNIVNPKEVLLTPTHLALVMELIQGGDLMNYMNSGDGSKQLSEDLVCYIYRQIVSAVAYCHQRHVAYRDLKLDNCLVDTADPPLVCLCDFGVARQWKKGKPAVMTTVAGTPGYMAPQVLDNLFKVQHHEGYDGRKADAWSCGALLVTLLSRHFPYNLDKVLDTEDRPEALYKMWKLAQDNWQDHTTNAALLSVEVRDLISQCLDPDETKRISVEAILQHPWVIKPLPEKYQARWDRLVSEQAENERRMASGEYMKANFDRQIDAFVNTACHVDRCLYQFSPRLDLRRQVVHLPPSTALSHLNVEQA